MNSASYPLIAAAGLMADPLMLCEYQPHTEIWGTGERAMGVSRFVIQGRTAKLLVGGTANTVGVLRDAEQYALRGREEPRPAPGPGGARAPRAVLVFGYGSDRWEDALVVAWEAGMTATNDLDWSGLPALGIARPAAGGSFVLCPEADAERPMTLDEAVAAGVSDPEGKLIERRRPRTVSARLHTEVAWTHHNPSSLGPVKEHGDRVFLLYDNGKEKALPSSPELSDAARVLVRRGALVGMTQEEAWNWIRDHAKRDAVREMSAVRVVADGRLDFAAGTQTAWMHPAYDETRQSFGILVGGGRGGAAFPQFAERAFYDIGDRLAGENGIRCSGNGYIALETGGIGILLTGFAEGAVGVACGSRFPREFIRDAAMRRDAPDGGRAGARALLRWEHEKMIVPPEHVGPFLADFGRYLAACGAAAVLPGEAAPTFKIYLERNGIAYGADRPEPGPGR